MTSTPIRVLAAAALLAALALPARAEGVRALKLGDSLSGTVEAGVEEVVPFDAVEGTLLDIDLKMAAASGPAVAILQPDRTLLAGVAAFSRVDVKGAALRIRKLPLARSGRHFLLVRPSVPRAYTVTIKGKAPSKALFHGFVFPDPPTEISFGAVPGSLLSITAKEAEHSGLSPKVLFVRAPGGSNVDLAYAGSHVLGFSSDVYKSIPLGELGHYVVGVGTTSGLHGAPGTVQVSIKLPKGKKVKAADADLVVDPFVDQVQPSSGFDNLAYAGVHLVGMFFRSGATVTLVGPESVPATGVQRISDTSMNFDVDLAGRATGDYDVVVAYPDGAEGTLVGGFRVLPTPAPAAILPATAWDNRTQGFTVTGTGFQAGLAVAVRPSAGGAAIQGAVSSSTAVQAVATLPLLDAPLGAFDVILTNGDGGMKVLPAALTVVRGPRFYGAAPLLGHDNDAARAVALAGNWFVAGMSCVLERDGESTVGSVVTGLSATAATATFDLRAKAAGPWTLRVTNPDGGTLTLGSPLVIARAPRPGVLSGGRFFDGEPVTGAALAGTDFVSGAQVAFEIAGAATFSATAEAVNGAGTQITFDAVASGAAVGDHDLRVTNPDGGSAISPAAGAVLGTRALTTEGVSAGRPSIAYNPIDGEYMAVYSVFDGSQRDIRGQRFSAATGKPVGDEILVTTGALDASTTEDQTAPCVVFAPEINNGEDQMDPPSTPTFGLWLVAYAWSDPNASGNTAKVLSQFVKRDGTLMGNQQNAYPLYGAVFGTVGGPRVAWNATRKEWLFVFGSDDTSAADVGYACLGEGIVLGNGSRLPFLVNSGVLVNNTHTVSTPGGPATINDRDYDPDVSWSAASNEYLVAYAFDVVEAGASPPPDTGIDVRAKVFAPTFAAGPSELASLTTLGNAASLDEGHPRVASGGSTYLVAWDYAGSAGNRDVQCWLVNAATRAKIGAAVTTVEQASSDDAAFPAVAWDGTTSGTGYVVLYPRAPGGDGTSSVVATRFPQSGVNALGTAVHKVQAAAAANAALDAGGVAVRGIANEFLAGWSVSGSARAPADAEVRFAK